MTSEPATHRPGRLAAVAEVSTQLGQVSSRLAKRTLIADLLAASAPDQVPLVAAWLSGSTPQRRLGVGWAGLRAVEPLPPGPGLGIAETDELLQALAETSGSGSAARRAELLTTLWGRATAAERDFLSRLMMGDLRQGALESVVADAAAQAFGVPAVLLRRAAMLSGSTPQAVGLAATGGRAALDEVRLTVGTPVQPMLAGAAPEVDEALTSTGLPALVDHKLDGIRAQVHRSGDQVRIFTRSLDDITARLPQVVAAVLALPADSLVLDGEVLGKDSAGRPAPFQQIASVAASKGGAEVPGGLTLGLYCFDLLHLDGDDLMDRPLTERLAALARLVPAEMTVPRVLAETPEQAREAFDRAIAEGYEGVVVKQLDGSWQAGRRASGWVKVKPRHTLDLVVLAAEWGYGRRTGWLSNLHLGARDGDGFVMVGKTFKGLTDELLRWQTEHLAAIEARRTASTVSVEPRLVVEIAVDGVQQSTRYPGGVALRFARVVRYRPDKQPDQATSIEQVRALWAHGAGDADEDPA